jgi:SAM-dependent methyltransferase
MKGRERTISWLFFVRADRQSYNGGVFGYRIGEGRVDQNGLSRIVQRVARQVMDGQTAGALECLEALDDLEFHILDRIEPSDPDPEMEEIRVQASELHSLLMAQAQAAIDHLLDNIRAQTLSPSALKALFNQYADSVPDKSAPDVPGFDLFDDFLVHLFQVDYVPAETRQLMVEMIYLQPTPGRVVLDMINVLPLAEADCFYDLGSGLGHVVLMTALLTGVRAVGIEYQPSYVEYARRSARKLRITNAEFRSQDARKATLSDGTVFFMYTPFRGSILRTMLDRLREVSRRRAITLCTYGPITPIVEQEPWLTPVRHSEGQLYRLAILCSHLAL